MSRVSKAGLWGNHHKKSKQGLGTRPHQVNKAQILFDRNMRQSVQKKTKHGHLDGLTPPPFKFRFHFEYWELEVVQATKRTCDVRLADVGGKNFQRGFPKPMIAPVAFFTADRAVSHCGFKLCFPLQTTTCVHAVWSLEPDVLHKQSDLLWLYVKELARNNVDDHCKTNSDIIVGNSVLLSSDEICTRSSSNKVSTRPLWRLGNKFSRVYVNLPFIKNLLSPSTSEPFCEGTPEGQMHKAASESAITAEVTQRELRAQMRGRFFRQQRSRAQTPGILQPSHVLVTQL